MLLTPTSGGHPDPVEIAGQLLGDIGFPPGRKAHGHNQGGTVGHTYWNEEEEKKPWVMCWYTSHKLYMQHNASSDLVDMVFTVASVTFIYDVISLWFNINTKCIRNLVIWATESHHATHRGHNGTSQDSCLWNSALTTAGDIWGKQTAGFHTQPVCVHRWLGEGAKQFLNGWYFTVWDATHQ